MNKEDILHKQGYYIIRNNEDIRDIGLLCINSNDTINYSIMKKFIDTSFFNIIKSELNSFQNVIYNKFRFSNNNNSKDASTFHGDNYNHTNEKLIPIYTALCYFDPAQLEVIPGTHLLNDNSIKHFVTQYNNRQILDISPGDIIVFHSNLHHRGIGFDNNNRRLLQVFNIFPNNEIFSKYAPKLKTVISEQSISGKFLAPLSYYISKVPLLINLISFFSYYLMINDLQYKIVGYDFTPKEKMNKIMGYEPLIRKNIENLSSQEVWNVNVICYDYVESLYPSSYYTKFLLIFLILFIIILISIKYLLKNRNYIKKLLKKFRITKKYKF